MIFRQLFDQESATYTYLLADPTSKDAIIIDPVREQLDRDLKLIRELGLNLRFIADTHVHADHVTSADDLRKATGAKTAIGAAAGVACADLYVKDGETFSFGSYTVTALATPGHTNGCMSYLVDNKVFTGDALFVRGTGRTDFQQGSPETLFESITKKLYTLPDDTLVYPGHDYKGQTVSSVAEERAYNPRVKDGTTRSEFVLTMKNLKLDLPKKIHEALPLNLKCGKEPLHA